SIPASGKWLLICLLSGFPGHTDHDAGRDSGSRYLPPDGFNWATRQARRHCTIGFLNDRTHSLAPSLGLIALVYVSAAALGAARLRGLAISYVTHSAPCCAKLGSVFTFLAFA